MKRPGRIFRLAAAVMAAASLLAALYIMANHLGISPELDFGAGAYYYADIPDFDKIEKSLSFTTSVPVWLHVLLFLLWGYLMYRLWCWIDSK